MKTSVDMVRGVQIAADEINKAGGVNGNPIKLIVEDSEYKTAGGADRGHQALRRRQGAGGHHVRRLAAS